MDSEDDKERGHSLSSGDPVPPADWTGFGQEAAMKALYNMHHREVARYLRRRAPRQDVGDLVQESFRRFAAKTTPTIALIEKPGAYLVSIARNLLTDRARAADARLQSHHHSFEDNEIAGPDPHAALEAREALRRVEKAIARLKPQTGSIFVMHRFDGMSYDEIAAAKGISVKGVEWHIAQAMIAIRKARADHK
jgi:RNA polymerase sigma-70 factor (ECF subfamily)